MSIRLPVVQTWVVKQVTHYLSSQLGTKVEIGGVNIDFFDSIRISNLYIGDQNQDTILQAKEINAGISVFSLLDSKLKLKSITIESGTAKISRSKSDRSYNIQFLIDYFTPTNPDTSKKGFEFDPGEIILKNMSLAYRDFKWDGSDGASTIDFDDIRLDQASIRIRNLKSNEYGITAMVSDLKFIEKSGFKLSKLDAKLTVDTSTTRFEDLKLETPSTKLLGMFEMNYSDASDFEDFISKVEMKADLENSTLNSTDVSFFASEFSGTSVELDIKGQIKGTVDNLRGKNLDLRYGENTRIRGSVSMTGLPDIDETYFDLKIEELKTNFNDLARLPKIPANGTDKIELPSEINSLGMIEVDGKFNGFLSDFVAYANFQTAIGFFSSDVNFKVNSGSSDALYSGHISASELDLGKISGLTNELGKSTFKLDIKGKGLDRQHLNATLVGNISALQAYGYNYQSIDLNGKFKDKVFEGKLNVEDPNLFMDFTGLIDMKSKRPSYVFNVEMYEAKPTIIGWMNRDPNAKLTFSADASLQGNNLDDFTGTGLVSKLSYSENGIDLEFDDLTLIAQDLPGSESLLSIESDILDAELKGQYTRTKLLDNVNEILGFYLPLIKRQEAKIPPHANANFNIKLKNTKELLQIFYPELKISDGTTISGTIKSENKDVVLIMKSDSVSFNMATFEGVDLNINTGKRDVNFTNNFKNIIINDTLVFVNPSITGSTDKQLTVFKIASQSRDTNINELSVSAEARYEADGKTNIRVVESDITLNGKKWSIQGQNNIIFDGPSANISNLGMSSGDESVMLDGVLSKSMNDKLKLRLNNFKTEILNPLLAVYEFGMSGTATGNAEISGLLSKPGISSTLSIKELAIYQDTLGDAEINLDFDAAKKEIDISATVDRGGAKSIGVNGTYYILEPEDRMDFKISLQKTGLSAFTRYAEGIISDLRGKATGELFLTGNFKKPSLTGKVRLLQTSFLFDYLNTRYSLSDEIEFTERYFRFNNLTVNDENGNQAKVDGFVYHNHLSDFNLKFDISTNNFQILNTGPKQNELYYGKGYGSGKVKVYGPLDLIHISLALKTEKNTAIYIPLSNPEEVTQSGFINFIQKDIAQKTNQAKENEFSGIELECELSVTPDAEVQLIFDSKIGDIIKGRGNGNLRMSVDRLGDFKMFGDFQVESGDYLFTLQNLINKKFIVSPGGTIKWTGDPYDAVLDIQGVYKLRTSLYDLIKDSTLTQRIPVEVHLKLKDKLFNPALEFDVVIPDIDPTAQAVLSRYISTEQEKSTQTMSLLVLNRFAQANDVQSQSASSSSGIGANAAELLSQQLSVWASQISDAFNLGVNYRAADAFSQEEYELELSTRLWNDRITIDGNVGLSDNKRNTTSGLVGDFNAEVKVSKDGRFRFKVFNKSINNILTDYNSPYTQGIGILYRKEFETFQDLFKKSKDFQALQ
ncbi:MAG: translocation/assembly module TamB domain-containing protein [Bacteroidota bacterium]